MGRGSGAGARQARQARSHGRSATYSTLNSPSSYLTNIAPLACAAEDESTLFWPSASLDFVHPTDDAFETSPSTLSLPPMGISTNAYPGNRPFSGLSVSQTAFDADPWPVEVDEPSYSYQTANQSRPTWDVNAHSSLSTDPVSLWTAPLLNGDPNSNHAPIPGCQSMNDFNVNLDFTFGPMADIPDFAGPYLAPSLDYSLANSNFITRSAGFEASSGTTFDTSLGYNPIPAIADEVLSPNTLSTMGPDLLPEDNNYLPQTQARSPDDTFNSEISPSIPNEHERVQSAHPNTCMECLESFKDPIVLFVHYKRESHTPFMCKCGKRFTRLDVLVRHVRTNKAEAQKYACPHCKSCPGGKSFKRKDHLTQHIRGYHHIVIDKYHHMDEYFDFLCPHPDCLQYRQPDFADLALDIRRKNKPFGSFKEFTQHMRTVHDDAPYPCDVRGCLRVRGKGYIRRLDLIKHRKREHPEAPKFENFLSCRLPGCSGNGENFKGIRDHYVGEHGYSLKFASSLANWW